MNHGGMDHGHSGHQDASMSMCNMSMIWNYETTNICILTSSWRITTPFSLYLSLTIIILASMFYEYLRLYIRRLDARLARSNPTNSISTHRRRASLLPSSSSTFNGESRSIKHRDQGWVRDLETSKKVQIWRSGLYASSVGISFLLMLIGMTFNAYIIASIIVGAGLGHYFFNRDLKSTLVLGGQTNHDAGLGCHL